MVIVLWWIDLSMHNKNKIKCNRIAHFTIVKYVYYIYRHSQSHHHQRFVYISPAGGKRNILLVNSFWKIFVFTFRLLLLLLFHFGPTNIIWWVRAKRTNNQFCRSRNNEASHILAIHLFVILLVICQKALWYKISRCSMQISAIKIWFVLHCSSQIQERSRDRASERARWRGGKEKTKYANRLLSKEKWVKYKWKWIYYEENGMQHQWRTHI